MKLSENAAALAAVLLCCGIVPVSAANLAFLRGRHTTELTGSALQVPGGKPAGSGWGVGSTVYGDLSKGVPRAGPTDYTEYSAEPEFTTFETMIDACRACTMAYPTKADATAPDGSVWLESCRAGPCNFRDPQTQPAGGLTKPDGTPLGPDGALADTKFCITLAPVSWYSDCRTVISDAVTTVADLVGYCTWKEEIFIPGPAPGPASAPLPGPSPASAPLPDSAPLQRLDGSNEMCADVIQTQGYLFYSDKSSCDSNLKALSGCCESMFSAMKCLVDEGNERGILPAGGLALGVVHAQMGAKNLDFFAKFCVPLCENTLPEFCAKYPTSDRCIMKNETCTMCTKRGAVWCPKLEVCTCDGPSLPCVEAPVRTPAACRAAEEALVPTLAPPPTTPPPPPPPPPGAADLGCAYAEMARGWDPKTSK